MEEKRVRWKEDGGVFVMAAGSHAEKEGVKKRSSKACVKASKTVR
jgi:hypothetical protein